MKINKYEYPYFTEIIFLTIEKKSLRKKGPNKTDDAICTCGRGQLFCPITFALDWYCPAP